jgi:hypothetical protein
VSAWAAHAALTRGLGVDAFARTPAADMRALLGDTATAAWPAFSASWIDLALDDYMADGGRYRRRRYACFTMAGTGAVREPHQPHFQTVAYNRLNGGIERWFAPVNDAVAENAVLTRLLALLSATFATAAGVSTADAAWHVEMHQFRIEARPGALGRPTPEGTHRDGVDWVAVTLVGRSNVHGGVTSVSSPAREPLGSFTLDTPLDTVTLDDRRVYHGVTPVELVDPSQPGWRDVLVLTFRDQRV